MYTLPRDATTETDRLPYPRMDANGRIPVRMGMLVVNAESPALDTLLDYVEAFIGKDATYRAHQGTDLHYIAGSNSYPIWYQNDALWAAAPALEEYAFLLANSVPQYAFTASLNPSADALVTEFSSIWRALRETNESAEALAQRMYDAQEAYLAGE